MTPADPADVTPPAPKGDTGANGAAAGSSMRDLAPRLISALVMIVLALGTLWAGGLWFVAFWFAAGIAIVWEWQRIVGGARWKWRLFTGVLALTLATERLLVGALDASIVVTVLGCLVVMALSGPGKRLWNGAGLAYAACLVLSVGLLRLSIFYGWQSIVWLFAVVWTTDIMAYFGGRLIGGPKLWPRVSPKKTWAGFLTGIISAALVGTAVAGLAIGAEAVRPAVLVLGLLTAIVSQGGDLFESSLKRAFDVKDSSHLIPGHGGVMDRLDGFLAAATFAVVIGVIRAGVPAVGAGLFRW